MKTGVYINAHKILVIPVVLGLMWWYKNWSAEAFIYLGIHGTYSLLWLIKQATYPDKRFHAEQPFWIGALFIFLPLGGYYLAPYFLISRYTVVPPQLIGLALFIYTMGIFLHYVSDAQKYYTLQLHGKGLITEGLFSRMRNPNYLGEILIYLAYVVLSLHWVPLVIWMIWLFGFFVRNMISKDRLLAEYPEFQTYRQRTGILFPRIFR